MWSNDSGFRDWAWAVIFFGIDVSVFRASGLFLIVFASNSVQVDFFELVRETSFEICEK